MLTAAAHTPTARDCALAIMTSRVNGDTPGARRAASRGIAAHGEDAIRDALHAARTDRDLIAAAFTHHP